VQRPDRGGWPRVHRGADRGQHAARRELAVRERGDGEPVHAAADRRRASPGRRASRPPRSRGERRMTAPVYSFLPWLRSGVANRTPAADLDPAVRVRARLAVDLTARGTRPDGSTDDHAIHRDVQLYGPGDIIGIERRAIIKVEPRDWVTNFEPNYLPYVEFY